MPINYRTNYDLLRLFDDLSDEYDALLPEHRPRFLQRLRNCLDPE